MIMEERQILIEQMVSDICSHALRLDDVQLQTFLGWLEAHSSRVKTANQVTIKVAFSDDGSTGERFKEALKGWFESLSISGLPWEYHLILNEIAWLCEPAHMMKLQGRE